MGIAKRELKGTPALALKEPGDIAKITGSGGTVYTAKTPQDVSAVLAASLQNRSSN